MSRNDPLLNVPVLHYRFGQTVVEWRTFANIDEKVDHLEQLASGEEGALDCTIMAIARLALQESGGDLARALEWLHNWRARNVRYVPEAEEILETPRNVISDEFGYGDCEAHGALACALARAAGARAVFVTMGGTPENPAHGTALVSARSDPPPAPRHMPIEQVGAAPLGWMWSDTSVQGARGVARFNEHPYEAALRLGTLDDPESAI